MLSHADLQPRIPSGFCCVGSTPVAGGRDVRAWRVAGGGRAGVGRDDGRGESLVSGVAGEGAAGVESRRARGPQTSPRASRLGEARARVAGGARGAGLYDRGVDVAARGDSARARNRRGPSSGPCLARAAGLGVVAATPRPAVARARRGCHRGVEAHALAAAKKNAKRQRAWLVFEDESGVSQQPVVRRTWAPRGETPILIHTGGNWKRLSIAGAWRFAGTAVGPASSSKRARAATRTLPSFRFCATSSATSPSSACC